MKIAFVIAIAIIVVAVFTYDKWSYKALYKRQEVNSKHPDWKPYCGINFLEKDPQWFIENGYEKYVK
ncbi:MAG: hypothetical protein IKA04_03460 [Alistipes sp.]|nr:hypothetical protein [Alistipes sp.]